MATVNICMCYFIKYNASKNRHLQDYSLNFILHQHGESIQLDPPLYIIKKKGKKTRGS